MKWVRPNYKNKMLPEDFTIEELQKRGRGFYYLFVVYAIISGLIAGVGGYYGYDIIQIVLSMELTGGTLLLVLFSFFGFLNFFLLLFVWTTNESSYYRMLEQFTVLFRYLKRFEDEAGPKEVYAKPYQKYVNEPKKKEKKPDEMEELIPVA